jgi:hypothetical protein
MNKLFLALLIFAAPLFSVAQPVSETRFGFDVTDGYSITGFTEYNDMLVGTGTFFPAIYSIDKGLNWLQGPPGLPQLTDFPNSAPGNVSFAARHLAFEGDLVMLTSEYRYIQLSLDRGQTWELINTGIANNLTFQSAKILNGMLLIEQNSAPGFRISRDSAKTWQSIAPVGGTTTRSVVMYRDTLFANVFGFVTAPRIYHSVDMGITWTAASAGVPNNVANNSTLHVVGDTLYLLASDGNTYRWSDGSWVGAELPGSGFRGITVYGNRTYLTGATGIWEFDPVSSSWNEVAPVLNGNLNPYTDLFQVTQHIGDDYRLISYSNTNSVNDPSRISRVYRTDLSDNSFSLAYAPGINSMPQAHFVNENGARIFVRPSERFYTDTNGRWTRGLPVLTNNNELILDATETSEGILATTSTGRVLLFGKDLSGPQVVLTSVANAWVSSTVDKVFLISGSTLRVSRDGGKTFEAITGLPSTARLAKVTFSEEGILAGNMVSTDGGDTWTQAFTLPSNRAVNASVRQGDVFLAGSGAGLYVKAGNENPVLVDNGGISGTSSIQNLVTTGKTAVFNVGRTIYFTTNNGQTIETLTTVMPTTATIRSMSIHDNVLYVANSSGLQSWDLSSLGATFFVQTLAPDNITAVDSSRVGVRANFKGIVNSPAQEVRIYFEYRILFANTILGTTPEIVIQPAPEEQEIEIIFSGLPPDSWLESRIVGISGDVRINGNWTRYRTPEYDFWQDITPEGCITCSFFDGVSLSDGRFLLSTNTGVLVSDDRSVNWENVVDSPIWLTSMVVTENDTIIGGTLNGMFYRSIDRGETWERIVTEGLPGLGGNQRIVRMAYSKAYKTMIAIYGERQPSTNNAVRVIFSENGGRIWSVITDTLELINRLPLSMASDEAGNLYIGTNSQDAEDPILRRSTDGGYTWEALVRRDLQFVPTIAEVTHIDFYEGSIVFKASSGFWKSDDDGLTFERERSGIGRQFVILGENEYLSVNGRIGSDNLFLNDALNLLRPDGSVLDVKAGYVTSQPIHRLKKFDDDVILALSNRGLYRWRMGGDGYWVSIDDEEDTLFTSVLPRQIALGDNYPNPFNPITTIPFTLAESASVRIEVYNMLGQLVAVLVNDYREAGMHTVGFDARSLSSGVYIYRLQSGTTSLTGKMLLMK